VMLEVWFLPYVALHTPTYTMLSVGEHLTLWLLSFRE